MKKEQAEIIKRQIAKKIKKLAELEEKQSINNSESLDPAFMITRKILACIDGFIILRTFSKNYSEPFQLITSPLRISLAKIQLPIKTTDGHVISLSNVIDPIFGVNWRIGTKLDIGSQGGGIKINGLTLEGFQLMIFSYKEMDHIKETLDDINFIIYSNSEIEKLSDENNDLKLAIEKLDSLNGPLIISEGKTDWKYFISALRYFHSKNQFLEIEEKWFLKFGSKNDILSNLCDTSFEFENSVSKLNKILDSYLEARKIDHNSSKPIRIGIFDSDDKQAKSIIDKENKVYSFLIQPSDISTEFLFSEEELKYSVDSKRLYIGEEFDLKTKKLITNTKISLGGDNNNLNKAGRKVIIDSDVYDENSENKALSKEKFAQNIYDKRIQISESSFGNFKHIFEKILELIKY